MRDVVVDVGLALDGARREEDVAAEEAEALDVELGADRVVRLDLEPQVAPLRLELVDGGGAELVVLGDEDAAVEGVDAAAARDGRQRPGGLILELRVVEVEADVGRVALAEVVVEAGAEVGLVRVEGELPARRVEEVGGARVARGRRRQRAAQPRGERGEGRGGEEVEERVLRVRDLKDAGVLEEVDEGRLVLTEALDGGEEEGLVALERPADAPAVLLPAEVGLARGVEVEGVARVEALVAEEAEEAARPSVRARLRDDVDDAARGPAELGVVAVAQDLELLHRLLTDGRLHAARDRVGLAAVDGHEVAAAVVAAEGEARLRRLRDAEVGGVGDVVGVGDAGREQGVVEVVAAADGEVRDLSHVDDRGLLRAVCLDDLGPGHDVDALAEVDPDLHGDVGLLADRQLDAGRRGGEGLGLDRQLVGARQEVEEGVGALPVGRDGAGRALGRVGQADAGAGDGRAGRVSDLPAQLGRRARRLRERGGDADGEGEERRQKGPGQASHGNISLRPGGVDVGAGGA